MGNALRTGGLVGLLAFDGSGSDPGCTRVSQLGRPGERSGPTEPSSRWSAAAMRVALLFLIAFAGSTVPACSGCLSGDIKVTVGVDPGAAATAAACTLLQGINSYSCSCSCSTSAGLVFGAKSLQVCAPETLNGCKGGTNPNDAQEMADCSGRVQSSLQGMVQLMNDPSATCSCTAAGTASDRVVISCNNSCTENAMPAGATTWFDTSTLSPFTNAAGGTPVCAQTAIDPPVVAGVAGAVWAPRTACDVSGQITLVSRSEGLACPADHPCMRPVGGQAGFIGTPCPGQNCNVDFGFGVALDDFFVDVDCSVLGFGDFCEDLAVTSTTITGEGTASVALNSAGAGSLATGQVDLASRAFQNGQPFSFKMTNPTPTSIVVNWAAKTCVIDEQLSTVRVAQGSDSITLDATLHLAGTLVNQPPTANAGADHTFECTSASGTTVHLDGSGSTDPDSNITWYTWRAGPRLADPLISAGSNPAADAVQTASTASYTLRVSDEFGALDDDSVTASVVDTTPPTIASVSLTPSCLWPPNHKYVLFRLGEEITAGVSDACDAAPVVQVVNVVSSQPDNGRGDGNSKNDVIFGPGGFCVRSEREGGDMAGRTYIVTISATDGAGNETTHDVALRVPHSAFGGCPALPPSQFISDRDVADLCSFPEPLVVNRPVAPPLLPVQDSLADVGCSAAGGTPVGGLMVGMAAALAVRRRRRR